MYFINPFKALRPTNENASGVAITSTDHLTENTKRNHIKNNPWSYLNVFNAENSSKSKDQFESIVTLSPLTPVATHYHIRNGARLIKINPTTQNFEYKI